MNAVRTNAARRAQQPSALKAAPVRVSPAHHPLECEAQLTADSVMSGSVSHDGPSRRMDASRAVAGGQPMDASDRRFFEARMGQDFSDVRIHADTNAAQAASVRHARAYTTGSNIVFAAGQYAPGDTRFRRVLAHELVHVMQARSRPWLVDPSIAWRLPAQESADPTVNVALTISAGTSLDGGIISNEFPPGIVDLTSHALFEGDVFSLELEALADRPAATPVRWQAPPDLQRVEDVGERAIQLRVPPGSGTAAARIVEVQADDGSGKPVTVRLSLQGVPQRRGVVDPRLEENERARFDMKVERRQSRADFRALSRTDRRATREARREGRGDERQRTRVLRRERRLLEKSCTLKEQRLIDAAIARAIQAAATAVTRLRRADAAANPAVASALGKYLKLGASDITPTVLQRVVDVLSLARNSMLISTHEGFDCTTCSDTTGAYVIQNSRGGLVSVCQKWLLGNGLNFDPASDKSDARAYALLHEYVHLSGPSASDERYVGESKWVDVSATQALDMADAYAAIAWALAGGVAAKGAP